MQHYRSPYYYQTPIPYEYHSQSIRIEMNPTHMFTDHQIRINRFKEPQESMFVSFSSEGKDIFEFQQEHLVNPQSTIDSVEIKQEEEETQLKDILRQSRVEQDFTDKSEYQHRYRSNAQSEHLNPEEELYPVSEETHVMRQVESYRNENNMETSSNLHYYKQIFFIVHKDEWQKIEVDLKSYPKSWGLRQLAETLTLIYAEETNKQVDPTKFKYQFKFFRYVQKSGKEEVLEIDMNDTVKTLRALVDGSFSLDYFWLKLL